MKTVYHTLSCIENTVQLRNAGFIKWTNIYDTPFLVYHSTEVRETDGTYGWWSTQTS